MLDIVNICNRVIRFSFYSLFFLVPLILTPWNYELFEFNKMILVYLMAIIIVSAWTVKAISLKKIVFRRSFWDIPLVIFFVSQFLSFVFSIDHHTSAWGYYSRFNGGLISIIAYILLYWAFVSNMNKKSTLRTIKTILASGVLVSLYGILEHFGIDAQYWVQDVRNRVFSTLGQPNWLGAWLIALIPLTWTGVIRETKYEIREAKYISRITYYLSRITYHVLPLIFYFCLLYTRSRSGVTAFAVIFITYWSLLFLTQRQNWRWILPKFLMITLFLAIISVIAGTPWTPSINNFQFSRLRQGFGGQAIFNFQKEKPEQTLIDQSVLQAPLLISESGDIRKVVWKGAIDIWKHYPIFGTGPETFAYSYYWYRPREHNDLSEWDFLYNKAHNEYLNFLATTGVVGLTSYLLLIGSFVFWSFKKIFNFQFSIFNLALLTGFSSILITNFFGFSVVPVSVLFFLYPAMTVVMIGSKEYQEETKPKIKESQYGIMLIILILAIYLVVSVIKYWKADTKYSYGEKINKAGQYDLAFNTLQAAINLKPNEPVYHDELSLATSSLAVLSYKQKNATLSSELQNLAILESNTAIKISPYNLSFWKNRTKVFYKLAEIDSKFYQQALDTLLHTSELAPTEPKIKYNLGLIYATLGQNNAAIQALEETVALKPNYEDARYALAIFYEQAKQTDKAREQLEYILKNINPASEKAKEKLKTL